MRLYRSVRLGVVLVAIGFVANTLLGDPGEPVLVNGLGYWELNGDAVEPLVLTSPGDARPITARPMTDEDESVAIHGTNNLGLACQGFQIFSADQREINLYVRRSRRRLGVDSRRRYGAGEDPCASVPREVVVER